MAYTQFAYWYDILNQAADYDILVQSLKKQLHLFGVPANGLVADLGCGTGEISLRLEKAGYDMISVDASPDMLSVFREKLAGDEKILLLCQDLAQLDLYGTLRGAVSTFDVFSHMPRQQLLLALQKVHLFLEPGGVLLFDVNTPYKHRQILANNHFVVEAGDGILCRWNNSYLAENESVCVEIEVEQKGKTMCIERFYEYAYPLDWWKETLTGLGFTLADALDGETFGALRPSTQRYFIAAHKEK